MAQWKMAANAHAYQYVKKNSPDKNNNQQLNK